MSERILKDAGQDGITILGPDFDIRNPTPLDMNSEATAKVERMAILPHETVITITDSERLKEGVFCHGLVGVRSRNSRLIIVPSCIDSNPILTGAIETEVLASDAVLVVTAGPLRQNKALKDASEQGKRIAFINPSLPDNS